jgi:formylglycine-generating enzyme required for sulfatase activity
VTVLGGPGYRLPTEAEWEYACRAKSTTKYCFGDSVKELSDYAWYAKSHKYCCTDPVEKLSPYTWWHKDDPDGTQAVGQKKPNRFGLYDMHGNVWEWCADWYDDDYYANSPQDDPTGPATGWLRVFRGGCWIEGAWFCRSVSRFRLEPSSAYPGLGFRVAQSPFKERASRFDRFLGRHKRPRTPAFPTPVRSA